MSIKEKLNIFILSSWYPSNDDPFFGLFIKQTATYLSENVKITVLNVNYRTDKSKTAFIVNETQNDFTEIIAQSTKCKIGILNSCKTLYLIHKIYKKAVELNGKPNLIHLQILSALLWYAYFRKFFSKIPFVVSEHWSKYIDEEASIGKKIKYRIQNCILKKATAITVVSEPLKQSMVEKGFQVPFYVIPNPVDAQLFKIKDETKYKQEQKSSFVHISCFDEKIKNISGIIEAVELLNNERDDFELILVGEGPDYDKIYELVKSKKIKNIHFKGALNSEGVVDVLNQSSALIMNSYKETFGIPVIEAWMCGRPVISTPVGVVGDEHPKISLIKTSFNDVKSIVLAMKNIIENPLNDAEHAEIRKYALEKYDKEIVIKEFLDIYSKALPAK